MSSPFYWFHRQHPSPWGNLSHGTVIQTRPIQTSTSKSISPMSPSTLLTMSFSTRPSLPPSKAPPSNGLPPCHHTPSITLTPSPTCSLLTSPAAAHIKLQPSLFFALEKNKMRRSELSSTALVRLPSAHHTLTKKWFFSVWHSLSNPTLSPTTFAYTQSPPCMNWSSAPRTTSAWKGCKLSTQNSATTIHPPWQPLLHNLHDLILDLENLDNLASPDTHP